MATGPRERLRLSRSKHRRQRRANDPAQLGMRSCKPRRGGQQLRPVPIAPRLSCPGALVRGGADHVRGLGLGQPWYTSPHAEPGDAASTARDYFVRLDGNDYPVHPAVGRRADRRLRPRPSHCDLTAGRRACIAGRAAKTISNPATWPLPSSCATSAPALPSARNHPRTAVHRMAMAARWLTVAESVGSVTDLALRHDLAGTQEHDGPAG